MADELRAFGILNEVELNRRDPASKPGLSPLGSRSPIIVILTLTLSLPKGKGKNPRICIAHSARYLEGCLPAGDSIVPSNRVNLKGTPPSLTICVYNKTASQTWEKPQCPERKPRTEQDAGKKFRKEHFRQLLRFIRCRKNLRINGA